MKLATGTDKGLLIYEQKGESWSLTDIHFIGMPIGAFHVDFNGNWWVAINHKHWGQKYTFVPMAQKISLKYLLQSFSRKPIYFEIYMDDQLSKTRGSEKEFLLALNRPHFSFLIIMESSGWNPRVFRTIVHADTGRVAEKEATHLFYTQY